MWKWATTHHLNGWYFMHMGISPVYLESLDVFLGVGRIQIYGMNKTRYCYFRNKIVAHISPKRTIDKY